MESTDSQEMVSIAFADERRSPQHLHMTDAIVAFLPFLVVRDEAGNNTGHWFSPSFFFTSPYHLLRRDGAKKIYLW